MLIPNSYKSIIDKVKTIASEYNFEAYIVGGFVRDLILNRHPKDLDIMIEAKEESTENAGKLSGINFSRIMSKKYNLSDPVIFERFGTAKLLIENQEVEFVMPRKEYYNLDSRKPDTEITSLQQDALRRDFTINALFLRLSDNSILDLTKRGISDIKKKVIRVTDVKNADIIFNQDPLRILRAVRQHLELGFTIDKSTYSAMKLAAKRIRIVSFERIRDELDKILIADKPSKAILMLDDLDLLQEILPEVVALKNIEQSQKYRIGDVFLHSLKVLDRTKNDLSIRIAALLHDVGKSVTLKDENGKITFYNHDVESAKITGCILKRFKYSKDFIKKTVTIVRNHMYPKMYSSTWSDGVVRRLVQKCGKELNAIVEVSKADFDRHSDVRILKRLLSRIEKLKAGKILYITPSLFSGKDLMEMFNRPQGKWIKDIKNRIEEIQIENPDITKEDIISSIKLDSITVKMSNG